jgi:pimeloyl-ACP methyl ester carboxylesterase
MPLRTQAWMMNHADSLINQIRSVVLDGDTNAAIAEVRVPALVIWGTASIPQTMANARTLAARITGACTAIIDGAGHMLPISHADNVNHHIAQFLKV